MTKEDLSDIANMVIEIIGVRIASERSGPSFNFREAVEEAIDRAWWQIDARQPEDPLEGL